MASEIRVNKITHTAGVGTITTNVDGIVVAGIVTANSFSGSGANLTGVSGPEVYGFTGIGSNLQVRTTNKGADNITGAQYDAFEQVLFAPSGITFSINNSGNLIATFDDMATIDLGKIKQVFRGTYNNATAYVPDDLVVFTDGSILHQLISVRLHQQETIHHQVEQHTQTGRM